MPSYIETIRVRVLSVPLQYGKIRRTRYLQQIAGPTLPAPHVPIRQGGFHSGWCTRSGLSLAAAASGSVALSIRQNLFIGGGVRVHSDYVRTRSDLDSARTVIFIFRADQ